MGRGYSGNHPRFSKRGDERYDAKEAYNKDLTASARLHYLENDRHDHESPMNNIGANPRSMMGNLRTINQMANYAHDDQGYIDDPTYTHGMKFGYEDYRAPGGYEYDNVQAMARHADMRNAFGLDADQQRDEVNWMKMDDIPVEPTGYNNSMFAESPMPRRSKSKRLREKAIKISERSGAERGDEYDYENPRVQRLLDRANTADQRSNYKGGKEGFETGKLLGNMTRHIKPLPKKKVNDERSGEIRNEMIDEMIDDRPDSPFNACAKSEGGSGCIKQMGGAWRVISNKTDKPWPAKYASRSKAEAALRGYHAG